MEKNKQFTDQVILKAEQICSKYHFKYNEKATAKLSKISNLIFRTIHGDNNTIIFNTSSADRKQKEIVVADKEYNVLNRYDMSQYYPRAISCIEPFEDKYMVSGITVCGEMLYYTQIFSKDFKLIGKLEDKVPFFKNKQISTTVNDDKGGTYFCEAIKGIVHYLDQNGKISSFHGDFKEPFQVSYFNDTLYITDYFLWLRLKKACNISIFKNNRFSQTNLSGQSICYSSELNCFFLTSTLLENCIRKYDAEGNLILIKDFDFNNNNYKPFTIATNNNHLLVCVRNSNSPIVYDIY